MSSLSLSFPGYAENVNFTRVDRGFRAYFLSEDNYLAALRDPSIILDAAYVTSPEHPLFLRNFGPSSPLTPPAQTSRLKHLEFVLLGHGFLPVSDSYSWGVRRAHVISSRLQDRLPHLFETFSDLSPSELVILVLDALLDLGLPSSVPTQIQDATLTSLDFFRRDIITALTVDSLASPIFRHPLAPGGSIFPTMSSTALQFYCSHDQQASVENILSMVPEKYLSQLPPFAVTLDSTSKISPTPRVKPRLSTPPSSKPQLVLGTNTGITDLSTINDFSPRSFPLAKASPKYSVDSGSEFSDSDESSISHLNTLHPNWRQNARTFADQRLISYAASKPGFDFEGFNRVFDKMVLQKTDSMTTFDMEILISNILDYFLRQCKSDLSSCESSQSLVASASVQSVLPPPSPRDIFDLTADMDASSISSASTSPRFLGQTLGIDNITSVRYNPLVEHERNKDMLKKLEKRDILTLFAKFDAYKLNGGIYPLYQFIRSNYELLSTTRCLQCQTSKTTLWSENSSNCGSLLRLYLS